MIDLRAFNESVIDEFRANGGELSGDLADMRMLLLTTTGARTERSHTVPVGYVADGSAERLVVFASNRAAPTHPDWFHNIRTNPDVLVELGTRSFLGTASAVEQEERARLYELFTAEHAGTEQHQERVERQIPLVLIQPR